MKSDSERRAPRFPCSASAELICGNSIELTRVTELSRYGCYLENSSPFPVGSRVMLKIFDGGQLFEATATVLYARPSLGMGVAFRDVKSNFQTILEEWLEQSLKRQSKKPSIEDFSA
jgi:hypothetical protein